MIVTVMGIHDRDGNSRMGFLGCEIWISMMGGEEQGGIKRGGVI
jgi:hypothetical protein